MNGTNWKPTRLGSELDLLYGKGLPASARVPGDIPVYGSNGIVGSHNKYLVDGPGIIVGRKGSVGEVAFSDGPFWPIDTTYYVSNRGGNDWRFLYFLLQHLQLTGLNSHSTVPGLNRESVYSIDWAFPPEDEQEKIAAVLLKIQKALEIEATIVRNARDLKKSLMRSLFTHGLRGEPLKETEIGPLAASWSVSSLESVATFASGGTPSKERSEFWSGTIPWVSPKDLKRARLYDVQDHISEDGLAAGSTRVPIGTLFVVIRGMILNRDLPVAMAMKPMAFNQDIKAVLPMNRVNADFLLYTFENGKRRLFNQIGTSAHGTRTLMSDYLAKFKLPLPPTSEQQEIAAILQTVDRKIDIHESKKRSLQDLFRTMLHKLMTAQIRVNHLEIDTSEVSA